MKDIRIFVSSPSDVAEERAVAAQVIRRIQERAQDIIGIKAIFWEHEPLLATQSFQDQIPRPSEADIVVCILWSRLGTQLPVSFRRLDGSAYLSGTEFEFEDAAAAFRRCGRPDLLVYRKVAEPMVSLHDEGALLERLEQKRALDEFIRRWFHDGEGGFANAFHSFQSSDEYESLLEEHLSKVLLKYLPEEAREAGPLARRWTHESPFRGLESFEYRHSPVFYGRSPAITALLQRMRSRASANCAFVLVVGMSGGGKSSLVQAGLLPQLTSPGVIENVGAWRWCVFRPSDRNPTLCSALATALTSALPELSGFDLESELPLDPDAVVRRVRMATDQLAADAVGSAVLVSGARAAVALVIDQMEEIFTVDGITHEEVTTFFRAVLRLARSGSVYVMATLRGDFYARCTEFLDFLQLKGMDGQYDLIPPTPSELSQIIRYPALAAGLSFEVSESGQRLDEVIRDVAIESADALPLLEFMLDELFKRRENRTLTFAAYRELGGLTAALRARAEQVFEALDDDVRAQFGAVFRRLVALSSDENRFTRRTAQAEGFTSEAERRFVQAFVTARLFTADRDSNGEPIVRIAHEALLAHWPRVRELLERDQESLRVRGRVEAAAQRWVGGMERDDLLFPSGMPVQEAIQLCAEHEAELTPLQRRFIAASSRKAKRARMVRRAALGLLVLLAVAASIASVLASRQADAAKSAMRQASASLAITYLNEAERLETSDPEHRSSTTQPPMPPIRRRTGSPRR
jgi:hypothetical protein